MGDRICNSQLFINDPEYVRKPSLTPGILFDRGGRCRRWKVKVISKPCCSRRYRLLIMTVEDICTYLGMEDLETDEMTCPLPYSVATSS